MGKKVNVLVLFLSVLVLSFVLLSCGGGADPKTEENELEYDPSKVSILSISSSGRYLQAGHEESVVVKVKLDQSKSIKKLPVTVVFLSCDSDGKVVDEHYSGTYFIDEVMPGENSYNLTISVPRAEDGFVNNYTMVAYLYDKIMERQKSDVLTDDEPVDVDINAEDDDAIVYDEVGLDPELQDDPAVVIEEASVDETVLVLTKQNIEDSVKYLLEESIKLNLSLRSRGGKSVTDALLKVKLVCSNDVDVNFDLSFILEGNGENLNKSYAIDELVPYNDPINMDFRLKIDTNVAEELVEFVKKNPQDGLSFMLDISVESPSVPDIFKDAGNKLLDMVIVADDSLKPEERSGLRFHREYTKMHGNKWLGGGIAAMTQTGADKKGLYSEHWAAIPATLLCKKFNMFDATLKANAYFDNGDDSKQSGVLITIRRVDLVVDNFKPKITMRNLYNVNEGTSNIPISVSTKGIKIASEIFENCDFNHPRDIVDAVEFDIDKVGPEAEKKATKVNDNFRFAILKDYLVFWAEVSYYADIQAGPIPLTFRGALIGYAGIGAYAYVKPGVPGSAGAGVVPYAGLDIDLRGGIGRASWAIAVGVGGQLKLVNLRVNNMLYSEWDKFEDHENNENFMLIEYGGLSDLNIYLIKGSVYAYATYPWPYFKTRHGIPRFMGFRDKTSKYYLWEGDNWYKVYRYPIFQVEGKPIKIPLDL